MYKRRKKIEEEKERETMDSQRDKDSPHRFDGNETRPRARCKIQGFGFVVFIVLCAGVQAENAQSVYQPDPRGFWWYTWLIFGLEVVLALWVVVIRKASGSADNSELGYSVPYIIEIWPWFVRVLKVIPIATYSIVINWLYFGVIAILKATGSCLVLYSSAILLIVWVEMGSLIRWTLFRAYCLINDIVEAVTMTMSYGKSVRGIPGIALVDGKLLWREVKERWTGFPEVLRKRLRQRLLDFDAAGRVLAVPILNLLRRGTYILGQVLLNARLSWMVWLIFVFWCVSSVAGSAMKAVDIPSDEEVFNYSYETMLLYKTHPESGDPSDERCREVAQAQLEALKNGCARVCPKAEPPCLRYCYLQYLKQPKEWVVAHRVGRIRAHEQFVNTLRQARRRGKLLKVVREFVFTWFANAMYRVSAAWGLSIVVAQAAVELTARLFVYPDVPVDRFDSYRDWREKAVLIEGCGKSCQLVVGEVLRGVCYTCGEVDCLGRTFSSTTAGS